MAPTNSTGPIRVNPYFFFLVAATLVALYFASRLGAESPLAGLLVLVFIGFLAWQGWLVRPKRLAPGVLYEGITKAVAHDGPVERGWRWIGSRRNVLQVTETELRCGNWTIPYTEIEHATLMGWRSWLGIPGAVLVVTARDRTFQFGLMGSKFWEGELPFPVERRQGRPGYSTFSVVYRIAVLGYLVWWAWQAFGEK